MKGMAVAMALAQLRNAKEILASHPIESWMAPQNIETYKYLTEHVIREAKEALEYFGYDVDSGTPGASALYCIYVSQLPLKTKSRTS